jgi:hypothetical protein
LTVAARTVLPLVATVLTLLPVAAGVRLGAGIVVLGAAICLTGARVGYAGQGGRRHLARLLLMPVTIIGISAVAVVFTLSLAAGDALFVVVVFVATAARAIGPRAAAVGRAAMLPLMALFIAPVHLEGGGENSTARTIGWAVLAATVAGLWTMLFAVLLPDRFSDGVPVDGGAAPSTETPKTAARVHVWRGARSAVSLALAFVLAQTLFPQHWPWAVVAAFTIGVSARTRGDVLLKGAQRILGALVGTAGATLLTGAVAGHDGVAVLLILVFLTAGLVLREYNYLWWAMAITAVLALLYGLQGETGSAALLRERLLAGLLGAACAIGPALVLAPVRTHALVLKRAGAALRSVRAALESRDAADARRAEHDIHALREAAKPLLVVRPVYRRAEVEWVTALSGALPDLRALPTDGSGAAAGRLGLTAQRVGAEVREAAQRYRAARATT